MRHSNSDYAQRANILRKLGYKVSYKGNAKAFQGSHFKAAVTRLWEDKAVFYATNPEPNRLDFHKWSKKYPRKIFEPLLAPDQTYPGGFYIQRPPGTGRGEYKLTREGTDSIRIRDKQGRSDDVIIRLDLNAVLLDAKKHLTERLKGKKRPRQLMLNVNGFGAGTEKFEDLIQFELYLNDKLIPDLEAAKFNFHKWGKRVFGLSLIYTPEGRKKAEGEGKEYGESESIFSSASRRVYGRKRFYNRSVAKKRTGKRKGK